MRRASSSILGTLMLGGLLVLSGRPALAERADRDRPMQIESDSLRHDDTQKLTTFSGRVHLTQGTIQMRAERLEVREDAQGRQSSVLNGSRAQPAFFRQKREGLDEFIEAEADSIHYDSVSDTLRFAGAARLRRFRGAQLADELSGALIHYNNLTEQFRVEGASGDTTSSGRVRAMLSPKSAASAPVNATLPLRSASDLGGASR